MKSIFYKSKNNKFPGCSIDEITDDEYLNGFNFKIADGTEYILRIYGKGSSGEMVLFDKNGRPIDESFLVGSAEYKKVFKEMLDEYEIKLRDVEQEEDCGKFDFGEEKNGFESKKELINSLIKDLLSETKEYFYEGYPYGKDDGDRFDNLNLDNKIKNHSLEDDDIIEIFNIVLRESDNNLEADQGYYNSLKDLSSENTNFISGDGVEKMNELFEDYSDEEGNSEIDTGEFVNNIEYKTGYYFGLKSELEKN